VSFLITAREAHAEFKTVGEYVTGTPNPNDQAQIKPLYHRRYRIGMSYCTPSVVYCLGPTAGFGYVATSISATDPTDAELEMTFTHMVRYYQFSFDQEFYPLYLARKSEGLPVHPFIVFRAHLNSYGSSALSSTDISVYDTKRTGTAFAYEYGLGFDFKIWGPARFQFVATVGSDKYPVGDSAVTFSSQLLSLGFVWFKIK